MSVVTKNPLETPWSFWYDKLSPSSSQDWEKGLKLIYSFGFVEDFWR